MVGSLPQPADKELSPPLLSSPPLLVDGSLLAADEVLWLLPSVDSAPSLEVGLGSLDVPEDISGLLVADVVVAGVVGVTGGVTFDVVGELLEDDWLELDVGSAVV